MIHSRTGAMAFVSRWIGSFELLDTTTQFTVLSVVMFVTFGVHNVLQEAMLDMEGFTYGVMLGYMEVLGCVQ
jgi:adenosine 3'-phospho 5'-phosphosulfate transporter B3